MTLARAFHPRRNGLAVLRLVLAGIVAVVHTLQLSTGNQPVLGAGTELGALAVDGFFVASGFLVTGSMLRLGSVRRYTWHRFLRIMPGFWVCLLVTALVVAPLLALLTGRPVLGVFTGEDSAVTYVTRNALLLMRQFGVDGIGAGVPGDEVLDGALWTLVYEACCYALIALIFAVGLLRRRWTVVALTAVLQALAIVQAAGVVLPLPDLRRLALLFLLGACASLLGDRVPLRPALGVLAGASVVVGVVLLPDYRAIGAVGFAYLVLWLAARSPVVWTPKADLSYGVYVYHWPLALVVLTATGGLPGPAAVIVVLLVTALVSAASWRFVEGPALGFKSAAWVTGSPRTLLPRSRTPVGSRDPRP